MKAVAISFLVLFFVVKISVYMVTFLSKRGFTVDYSAMLSMILPIMSIFMYAGCYYVMSASITGFAMTFLAAWVLLIASILIVKYKRNAFIYITSEDIYDGYALAEAVVRYIKNIDSDILPDDNIGMSRRIKISFDRTKFSRHSMELLIDELYVKTGAGKRRYRLTLYAFLVHSVEFIFDTSFLINICML